MTRILMRRDTAANWASNNPVLGGGEIGYETDMWRAKIGDGETNWIDLPYGLGIMEPSYATSDNHLLIWSEIIDQNGPTGQSAWSTITTDDYNAYFGGGGGGGGGAGGGGFYEMACNFATSQSTDTHVDLVLNDTTWGTTVPANATLDMQGGATTNDISYNWGRPATSGLWSISHEVVLSPGTATITVGGGTGAGGNYWMTSPYSQQADAVQDSTLLSPATLVRVKSSGRGYGNPCWTLDVAGGDLSIVQSWKVRMTKITADDDNEADGFDGILV